MTCGRSRRRRAEVPGEAVAHAQGAGEPGGGAAGGQQPDGRQLHVVRNDADRPEGMVLREAAPGERQQLGDLSGELLRVERPHRLRGGRVAARGAAQSQIDPPGVQGLESMEGLGDPQRRVVGEHDAAGADADARCGRCHVLDQDLGGRAGDAGEAVMLGQPVARVAEPVREAGQVDRVAEGLGRRGAGSNGGQVEHGERECHGVNPPGR